MSARWNALSIGAHFAPFARGRGLPELSDRGSGGTAIYARRIHARHDQGPRHGDDGLTIGEKACSRSTTSSRTPDVNKSRSCCGMPRSCLTLRTLRRTGYSKSMRPNALAPHRPLLGHVRVVRRNVRRTARLPGSREPSQRIRSWSMSPTMAGCSRRTAGLRPKNKTTPFDRGHRTPIMVRWPGRVNPNERVARIIHRHHAHALGRARLPIRRASRHQPARRAGIAAQISLWRMFHCPLANAGRSRTEFVVAALGHRWALATHLAPHV